MKSQQVMMIITFTLASILIVNAFFYIDIIDAIATNIQGWAIIIAAFATGLASVNLIRIHIKRAKMKRGEWWNSIILVVLILVQTFIGIAFGNTSESYQYLYRNILTPAGATMYALLGFWIASAAYRAFVARSAEALSLLVCAVIVMLGNVPIGELLFPVFPKIGGWILDVANMAAQRGIIIGSAVGAIALGIRIMLGIERGHLGGE